MRVSELISALEDLPGETIVVIGQGKAAVAASGVDFEHFTKRDRITPAGVDDIDSFVRIV